MLSPVNRAHFDNHDSDIDVTRIAMTFDALSEPNRCLIFHTLLSGRAVAVGDLALVVGISDPLASQHLRTLREAGLVTRQKQGKHAYYRINHGNPMVGALRRAVES